MPDDALLLDAVSEVARVAGSEALRFFGASLKTEWKSDGSPVSAADRGAERAARDWITARFPNDGIVGEELGEHNVGAERRWIIDPVDGTSSFIHGVPLWGTLVAVARGDSVLAGAIHCPAVSELVCAAVGQGCWSNGARTSVSTVRELSRATVLTTDPRFALAPERRAQWSELAGRAKLSRSWGDCYGYLLVATGRAEVMADAVAAMWDTAALQPVITEAGGVFTDWTGRRTAFGGSAVATNAALALEARALLGCEAPHD
jgi:histidinol-phosphatase